MEITEDEIMTAEADQEDKEVFKKNRRLINSPNPLIHEGAFRSPSVLVKSQHLV